MKLFVFNRLGESKLTITLFLIGYYCRTGPFDAVKEGALEPLQLLVFVRAGGWE
jgi:hypothetical protein